MSAVMPEPATVPSDPVQAFTAGADQAKPVDPQEIALVKQWWVKINRARKLNEAARKQYAKDRRYARGDFEGEVFVNVIATFIDIWVSLLYAKDPDLDVMPAKTVGPMSVDAMMVACIATAGQDQQVLAQATQAAVAAATQAAQPAPTGPDGKPLPAPLQQSQPPPQIPRGATIPPPPLELQQAAAQQPPEGQQAGMQAWQGAILKAAQTACQAQRDAFAKRMQEKKEFGDTLTLIVEKLWKDGRLKFAARRWVRSALTVGIGWIKASWFERMGRDPVILQQINDIQDNIKRAAALKQRIDENATEEPEDAAIAAWKLQMQGLQSQVEEVIAKGMAFDFIRAENITVAESVDSVLDYLSAPWMSHRCIMRPEDAQILCPEIPLDDLKKATFYTQRPPRDPADTSTTLKPEDADEFVKGSAVRGHDGQAPEFLCIEEVWDRDSLQMLTLVEGLERFGRSPIPPRPSFSRFYPFVGLAYTDVDGDRHPQSLNTRSHPQADEVNRAVNGFALHRRRTQPKTMFNAAALETGEAERVAGGVTGEMVAVKTVKGPEVDMRTLFVPVIYAQLDPALYDTSASMRQFELIWGTSEALSAVPAGANDPEKTATQSTIEDKGTQARTSYKHSLTEEALTDIAMMTSEAALQMLPTAEAQVIAGPEAFWPEGMTVEQLPTLCTLSIRAGSSGKPDTASEQQAWSMLFPILKELILQIGQLRQASPSEVADALEELVVETIERSGDRLEVDRFIPQGQQSAIGDPPLPVPAQPIQESALTGPQTTGLLAILVDCAAGLIPQASAMASVIAAYPHIPAPVLQGMFSKMEGFLPRPAPKPLGDNLPNVAPGDNPQHPSNDLPQH